MQTDRVYVNNYKCLCSGAANAQELFSNLSQSKSPIKTNTTYLQDKKVGIGKIETDLEQALLEKLEEVLKDSNLNNFQETLLVIGSSVGGMKKSEDIYLKEKSYKNIDPKLHSIDAINYKISQKYKFKDNISFSTACTSSANALGYAYETIKKEIYKNVLVIGFDTLCKTTVGGFDALGVLSSFTCKPFDTNRDGMNVAEALAILLLQNKPNEKSVELCGVGYSSDAFHMTQPSSQGAKNAMQKALTCKGLKPQDIDYINAHGTGTKANDSSELKAIGELFGKNVPLSSTKPITGHTLGAAGALEAIISVMAIQEQTLFPTHNLQNEEIIEMNYVKDTKKAKLNYVLSNSFAFGGNNVSLLFGAVQ